jgi:hydrogenase/urease accessory protein HupE
MVVMGRRTTALLALAGALALAAPAAAHQFAPALLELEEVGPELAAVAWKQPAVRVQGSRLRPVLPVECRGVGDPAVVREGTGLRARWQIECPGGLAGKTVGVEGIATSRADVLLRVALLDGRKLRQVLTAEAPSFTIEQDAGRLGVLEGYGALGVEHILTGRDHLLFVLALVLLVGWGRSLLWTVTAFTLGHSVTLALAALGLVSVPQAPIEAAIALSIYVLAVELAASLRGKTTLTQRAPWIVASGFGLLHGLGFAGALSEVGLPPGEIPLALFSFNVGLELGQLAFVAAVLLATAALRALPIRRPRWAAAVPAYAIGVCAVYWFCERVAGIVMT